MVSSLELFLWPRHSPLSPKCLGETIHLIDADIIVLVVYFSSGLLLSKPLLVSRKVCHHSGEEGYQLLLISL